MSQKYGDTIGVRYIQYVGDKLVSKEKWFKTEAAMTGFLDKLEAQGKLHEVLSFSRESNPLRPRSTRVKGYTYKRGNKTVRVKGHIRSN